MPNVNYPPGRHGSYSSGVGEGRGMDSTHSYHYTAIVTFSDGRIVEVPAGYTTFHPIAAPQPASTSVFSATFDDGDCEEEENYCVSHPDNASFTAEVTLEAGNVVRQGDRIKGRVTVHSLINGSTSAKILSAAIRSERNNHWAKAQAASGSDGAAFSPGLCFHADTYDREIAASDCDYAYILGDVQEDRYADEPGYMGARGRLTKEQPYLDFDIKLTNTTIRNFHAYYATFETYLFLRLGVVDPSAVQHCMSGSAVMPLIDDTDLFEERLWDSYSPLVEPDNETKRLVAKVPITVIGRELADGDQTFTVSSPIHYLTPGAPSPLILDGPPSSMEEIVFPVVPPVITPESTADTTRRMLSQRQEFMEDVPDPRQNYHSGTYVGLLWKKKMAVKGMTHPLTSAAGLPEEEAQVFFGVGRRE